MRLYKMMPTWKMTLWMVCGATLGLPLGGLCWKVYRISEGLPLPIDRTCGNIFPTDPVDPFHLQVGMFSTEALVGGGVIGCVIGLVAWKMVRSQASVFRLLLFLLPFTILGFGFLFPLGWSFRGMRHRPITCLAFSSDGRTIATAAKEDNRVRLWSFDGGEQFALEMPTPRISWLSFSGDNHRLATALQEKVLLWDLKTGNRVGSVPIAGGSGKELAFSPTLAVSQDGLTLASFSGLGMVSLWDCTTGQQRTTLPRYGIWCMGFSPDGTLLATGSTDGKATIWDTASGKEIANHTGLQCWVCSVAFSPDETVLAAGSGTFDGDPGEVKLWKIKTGEELVTIPEPEGSVTSVAFDTAGSLLMTKTKLPFNCKKMKCETILRLWKISPDYKRVSPQGEVKEVEPLGFGLDGKAFVAVNRKQGTVTSWSVEPFKENRAIKMGHRGEEPNESTLVAFSAESGLVALANPDFTVWDIRSGEKWSLPGHGDVLGARPSV